MLFTRDLRVIDNPAYAAACEAGEVLPIFIEEDDLALGARSCWWARESLLELDRLLEGTLSCFQGSPAALLVSLCRSEGVSAVYSSRSFDPHGRAREAAVRGALEAIGVRFELYAGSLLWDPAAITTGAGGIYKVFTPFYQRCRSELGVVRATIAAPVRPTLSVLRHEQRVSPARLFHTNSTHDTATLDEYWRPGQGGALARLESFCAEGLTEYEANRNFPAASVTTSRLSPFLTWGNISPHLIFERIVGASRKSEAFVRELVWREFSAYTLWHTPTLPEKNYNSQFDAFAWRDLSPSSRGAERRGDPDKNTSASLFDRWCKGETGYPLVDAGMRELQLTGFMHNRVRMVVASFLVKNLLIDWRQGAAWFYEQLVDADIANNSMNWQWVAGTGLDAAPYFRIFNPTLQAKTYDPEAVYIRRFVPELASLNAPEIFSPRSPERVGYVPPVVDLAKSRAAALAAYHKMRG